MFQMPWRSRRWRGILAIVPIAPLLAIALVFWRASHEKEVATTEVLAKSEFPFRVIPVDRTAPAGVDPVAAVPGFRDLAAYKETIAVSARAGLFLYSRNGSMITSYRAGIEL